MCSGQRHEVKAYRGDVQGLHGKLLTLYIITRVYSVNSGRVTLGCDNEQARRFARYLNPNISWKVKHADIINGIRRLVSFLSCHVHIMDVDSHQDEKVPFHLLSPFEKLNCRADTITKILL